MSLTGGVLSHKGSPFKLPHGSSKKLRRRVAVAVHQDGHGQFYTIRI